MRCAFSRDLLALYVENDLSERTAIETVESHIGACTACRQYCEGLRRTQYLIKSGFECRHAIAVSDQTLRNIRSGVMSRIALAQESMGWRLRLERLLMTPLRRQRYAIAGLAFVMAASFSVIAQMRIPIGGQAILPRPDYREWVDLGEPATHEINAHRAAADERRNVYMDPAGFDEYSRSGKFQEGAVMVIETSSPAGVVALAASVRDAQYGGGWRYYDFTERAGQLKTQASPVAQTASCIGCHEENGAEKLSAPLR